MSKSGEFASGKECVSKAGFNFTTGRYYHSMWYLDLPPIPEATSGCTEGGNVVVLLWRLDGEPTRWHLQYRFRYYRDKTTKKDERVWYELVVTGETLEKVKQVPQFLLEKLAEQGREFGMDAKPQQLLIDGDNQKFLDVVAAHKPCWINAET